MARIIQSYRADTQLDKEIEMLRKLVHAKEKNLVSLEQQRGRMASLQERVVMYRKSFELTMTSCWPAQEQ